MPDLDIGFKRLGEAQLEQVRAWRNSPDVARFMYTDQEISPQQHRAWFERISRDPSASYWVIELEGHPVGLANVVDLDFAKSSASWAFYIADPRTRGKGVGQYVEFCVLNCVFEYWNIGTLNCQVLESNPDVTALHLSVGFKETRRIPARVVRDGRPVDAFAYAMPREEWLGGNRAKLEARVRAKGREPLPLLAELEAAELAGSVSPRTAAMHATVDSGKMER
jgi:UDP-4-amino-4,6-dideoxy-N-acetyl-beta-L-altrosamine N-acetyltransferase